GGRVANPRQSRREAVEREVVAPGRDLGEEALVEQGGAAALELGAVLDERMHQVDGGGGVLGKGGGGVLVPSAVHMVGAHVHRAANVDEGRAKVGKHRVVAGSAGPPQ